MRKFYEAILMDPTTFQATYSIREMIQGGGHRLIFSQVLSGKPVEMELREKLIIINKFLRMLKEPYLTGDEIKNFIDPMNTIEHEDYTLDELAKVAGVE